MRTTFLLASLLYVLRFIVLSFGSWIVLSFIGSATKVQNNGCGKVYPIDTYISTNWFCECPECKENKND